MTVQVWQPFVTMADDTRVPSAVPLACRLYDAARMGQKGKHGKKTKIKATQRENKNKKRQVIPVDIFFKIQKMALHVFSCFSRNGHMSSPWHIITMSY
ncbi:hypothetical protein AA16373_2244 [Komagataeibacter swingsii DSM 16373]|nr:hypothetical protein AA16373_2244 [Komagataeibacter swingsii DSM 16373]